MGQWSARKERFEKILRQILDDGDYCLIPHITSIDPSYYTRKLAADEKSRPRDPHPLFDSTYYRAAYLPDTYTKHPFCHFMTSGYKQGNKPSAYFDYDMYETQTGWNKSHGNPLRHYLKNHHHSLVSPGVFFDRGWYCDKTPTLLGEKDNALINYRLFGTREKKSPVPVFDPRFYLDKLTPDNKMQAVRDPFCHYAAFGIVADVKPCDWFDPQYYRKRYLEKLGDQSPLEHYLRTGVFQGCCADPRVETLKNKPVISIVVPVYNTEPHYLNNCIRSVLYQSYPYWELCLADDGSRRPETLQQLDHWKQSGDKRIKVVFHPENKGISAATNSAAALAEGDYIGFLDNDDELTPDCLFQTAKCIADTDAELVYTDEDLIGDDGRRLSLFFKPDFNHALLLSHNYITHFVAVTRELFKKCSGANSTYDGAQDFDFLLRAANLAAKIEHIPFVLYHWRAAATSVSVNNDQKIYAHNAGKKSLESYLISKKIDASVHDTGLNFFYRISRTLVRKQPLVTLLIWNSSDNQADVTETLTTIHRSSGYENCEVILLTEDKEAFNSFQAQENMTLLPAGKNKAESLQAGVTASKGEYIALLDSSVEKLQEKWLYEILSIADTEQVNIVCGLAEYADEPSSFEPVPDIISTDIHYYYKFLHAATLHFNGLHCTQYVTLPTADICLFSRDLYNQSTGFDYSAFPEMFTLADFALQAAEMGQKVFFTPHARAYYPTRPTKTADINILVREKELFQKKWKHKLREIDRYYNPGILQENNIDPEQFLRWQAGE